MSFYQYPQNWLSFGSRNYVLPLFYPNSDKFKSTKHTNPKIVCLKKTHEYL